MTLIEHPAFQLRSWQISDAPSLAFQANNPNIAAQLPDRFPQPYRLSDAESYIQFCIENHPDTLLAIVVDEMAVGAIGFKSIYKNEAGQLETEIGYWLGEPYWNKGIVSTAIGLLLEYGRAELSLDLAKALVFEGNVASKKALLKNGFEYVGDAAEVEMKQGKEITQWLLTKKLPD